MNKNSIYLVIVTYNRKELLTNCISSIYNSTLIPSVLVLNNASTDGTEDLWQEHPLFLKHQPTLVNSKQNLGGAGGFAEGLRLAIAQGAEWIWMMDDDAEPDANALQQLMQIADNPNNLYGSLAVNNGEPAWTTTALEPALGIITRAADCPERCVVEMLPLLGMLVHRDLVASIGLPDAGFFIAADDAEYCLRVRRAGGQIIVAGRSLIQHPKVISQRIRILGKEIIYLSLPPWKRYYDTRNRLLIARKYYRTKILTQTIPGSLVRLIAALIKEPHKLAQLHSFCAGFIDGLLGRKGKLHTKWGIK